MTVFIPTYFSPISQFEKIKSYKKIIFETEDNYEKQTFRNRCYIFGPNGKQSLNIPVKFKNTSEKKKTKDAIVDNDAKWQSQHLKSLQTAYRNSPFFEFYIDDLMPIFDKKFNFLLDINLYSFELINKAIGLDSIYEISKSYVEKDNIIDCRKLTDVKQEYLNKQSYIQMFDEKHGFLPNLSILDLLFMEGPNAINLI